MYDKIMVPIDLAHADRLERTLEIAADLSKHYGAPLLFVGITASQPGAVAHNPTEYGQKLAAFAEARAAKDGVTITSRAYTSHDPARDLDATLMSAITENAIDLVVMASHVPGAPEYLFASNAGYLAAHAPVSVFVVRPRG